MKDYQVQIKETLVKTVSVQAENATHARELVEKRWKDSEYILDADHFQSVTFTIPVRSERER